MASITKRKNSDGTVSFVAQVRLKGYKPTAKAFRDRAAAKSWAVSLEQELAKERDRGEVRPDLATLTLGDVLRGYLADEETKGLKSYADVERHISYWLSKYGNVRIFDFGPLAVRAARDKLRQGREPATVNRIVSALRSAWNWARAAGLVPNDRMFPGRVMLPEPKGRTRFLSDVELGNVLKAAETMPVIRAAILVSIATGLRQGELLRLTWSDIDFDRSTIRIVEAKNGQSRAGHLNGVAAEALRSLLKLPIVSATAVFVSDSGEPLNCWELLSRWDKVREKAGIRDFRWHDLRHSAASILAQHGATLLEIAHVLGHKSTIVTQRYSHLVAGRPVTGSAGLEEKLRKAITVKPS
jgi:integrase